MINWKRETIVELIMKAGHIALDHFENPAAEQKPDQSLVTAADHAVEAFLGNHLLDGADATLLGEETVGVTDQQTIDSVLKGVTWIVDPIDGTASYANRLPTWGISLSRMEDGFLTDGALFLPRAGVLLVTDGDQVLYGEEASGPSQWSFRNLSPVSVTERPYTPMGMISLPREAARRGRFLGVNPLQANGSAVYTLAHLVLGSYLAYVARIRLWDVAGAIPILRRLRFLVQFPDGRSLHDTITERDWVLKPGDPRSWKSNGPLYIAGSQDTVDYLRAHYHRDQER